MALYKALYMSDGNSRSVDLLYYCSLYNHTLCMNWVALALYPEGPLLRMQLLAVYSYPLDDTYLSFSYCWMYHVYNYTGMLCGGLVASFFEVMYLVGLG